MTNNMADMVAAGRQARGERISHSKLMAEQVQEIRTRSEAGESYAALGRAFGISATSARQIALRHTWRHVPLAEAGLL